jgi:hypothetical protein
MTEGRTLGTLLLLAAAVHVACSGGHSSAEAPNHKSIGPDGGVVSMAGGPSLVIPPGAVTSKIPITVDLSSRAAPAAALSSVYAFGPSGTVFAMPVSVSIPVTAGTTSGSIYWTKAGQAGSYDSLPATVSGGKATAQVLHFSEGFAGPACTEGAACACPNPCHLCSVACSSGAPRCGDSGVAAADGTACGADQACLSGSCVPAVKPIIASFAATLSTVGPGGSSLLSWSVSGADLLTIDQGVGSVTGSTRVVTPATTTTYTLTASNFAGAVTATATVTVRPFPAIVSFAATPSAVTPGSVSILAWNVSGADTLFIDQEVGAVSGTSRPVTPAGTTTYTLTAVNPVGSAAARATVTVRPLPAITSFEAHAQNIAPGGASTLSWSVTDADMVTIDPGIGTVITSALQVTPTSTQSYTLTASNAVGAVTASTTVTVSSVTRVSLNDVTVVVGRAVMLAPSVTVGTGNPSLELDWSVATGSLGSVSPARGMTTKFTAPVTPGRYVVWGTSTWDPTKRDFCNVDVILPPQFAVGASPHGLAFDGENVWVTNSGSDTVTKLRASDGALVGTFEVGTYPMGIAFDGSFIWVANFGSATLTKLRASDGEVVTTFAVPAPSELAFDGENVWVLSYLEAPGQVLKIRGGDGVQLGAYLTPNWAHAIAIVDPNVWIASFSHGGSVLAVSDGSLVRDFGSPDMAQTAVVAAGQDVFVAEREKIHIVNRYSSTGQLMDGTVTDTYTGFDVPGGGWPDGLAFDGDSIWVSLNRAGAGGVAKMQPGDRLVTVVCDVGADPGAMLFDGQHVWVVNAGSNTVSRL